MIVGKRTINIWKRSEIMEGSHTQVVWSEVDNWWCSIILHYGTFPTQSRPTICRCLNVKFYHLTSTINLQLPARQGLQFSTGWIWNHLREICFKNSFTFSLTLLYDTNFENQTSCGFNHFKEVMTKKLAWFF